MPDDSENNEERSADEWTVIEEEEGEEEPDFTSEKHLEASEFNLKEAPEEKVTERGLEDRDMEELPDEEPEERLAMRMPSVDRMHPIRETRPVKRYILPESALKQLGKVQERITLRLDHIFGGLEYEERRKEEGVFSPVLINIQEIVMLSSGLVLALTFLLFILFKNFWYDHFRSFNLALLIVFGVIALMGLIIVYFTKSDIPRLKGSLIKKLILGRIGFVLMGFGFTVFAFKYGEKGWIPFLAGMVGAVGVYFFIIASRSMSKWEAYRFTIFFIGALILVSVPVHETMNVGKTQFRELPLDPLNEVLLVVGMAITLFGIYLLRERSGYFGVWLFGVLILLLIPVHEYFGFINTHSYEPYDQSVGMVGAFLLLSGYLMFFYRYHQYVEMFNHIHEGNEYYEEGKTKNAEKEYRAAYWLLERMGSLLDYDVIWGHIGNIYARKRKLDAALTFFNIGLLINEKNDILWNDRGNVLFAFRQHQDAIDSYNYGIKLNKRNSVLYQNLGVALSTLGHHEEAIKNYDLALELDKNYEKAWLNKGKSLHDVGRYEEALKCYDNAIKLNHKSEAWMEKGDVLYLMKRFEEALECYDRYIESHLRIPEPWLNKGKALYSLGRYEEAIESLNKAIRVDEDMAMPYNLLGNTYAAMGNLEKAAEKYRIAIEKNPRYSRARFNRARTLAALGKDATEEYEAAVRITTPQRLNRIWFEEAVHYFNLRLEKDPADWHAWRARGNLFLRIGRAASAAESYRKALEINPDDPHLWNLLGIAHRRIQELNEALKALDRAVELKPDYTEVWNNRGNVLSLMGRFHDALDSYNKAVELDPKYRPAIRNRLICIAQLKGAVSLEPTPIKSSIEDYVLEMEQYRNQGYRVELLERLIQEGRPDALEKGFEDFRKRVSRLKSIELTLDEMQIEDGIKEAIRGMLKNPAMLNRILLLIDESKKNRRKRTVEMIRIRRDEMEKEEEKRRLEKAKEEAALFSKALDKTGGEVEKGEKLMTGTVNEVKKEGNNASK